MALHDLWNHKIWNCYDRIYFFYCLKTHRLLVLRVVSMIGGLTHQQLSIWSKNTLNNSLKSLRQSLIRAEIATHSLSLISAKSKQYFLTLWIYLKTSTIIFSAWILKIRWFELFTPPSFFNPFLWNLDNSNFL